MSFVSNNAKHVILFVCINKNINRLKTKIIIRTASEKNEFAKDIDNIQNDFDSFLDTFEESDISAAVDSISSIYLILRLPILLIMV